MQHRCACLPHRRDGWRSLLAKRFCGPDALSAMSLHLAAGDRRLHSTSHTWITVASGTVLRDIAIITAQRPGIPHAPQNMAPARLLKMSFILLAGQMRDKRARGSPFLVASQLMPT